MEVLYDFSFNVMLFGPFIYCLAHVSFNQYNKITVLFQKNHKMASRTFDTDEVIDMLSSDDSDMEIDDEESDLFESDMELSLDGSSDDDDITDGSTSDDDAQSSGWRAWRANDTDFPHHSFTANNVGPNLQSTPESELNASRISLLMNF